MTKRSIAGTRSFILDLHPLQRILLGIILAVIAYFLLQKKEISALLLDMILWIVFVATFNVTSWIILFKRPIDGIRKVAKADDGSKLFVFLMVLISSFASLCAVLLLMISKSGDNYSNGLFLFVAVVGMFLSWTMVHTVFAFHYAHMYYDDAPGSEGVIAEGLEFPKEKRPDYLDFAYFSFVIGCTFQVSDVEISARNIRRMVLLHGLVAFVLNTFVVALSINLIAGLNK